MEAKRMGATYIHCKLVIPIPSSPLSLKLCKRKVPTGLWTTDCFIVTLIMKTINYYSSRLSAHCLTLMRYQTNSKKRGFGCVCVVNFCNPGYKYG